MPPAQNEHSRPEDLRYMLGLGVEDLAPLHGLRNSLMHLDERLEQHFIDSPDGHLTTWAVSDDLADGEHMMAFKPTTKVRIFGNDEVDVEASAAVLREVQVRSGKAFMWLMPYSSVEVEEDDQAGT